MKKLGREKHELDKIEDDYSGTDRKKEEAFDLWLRSTTSDRQNWDEIIQGLHGISENALAERLSNKYSWKEPRVNYCTDSCACMVVVNYVC